MRLVVLVLCLVAATLADEPATVPGAPAPAAMNEPVAVTEPEPVAVTEPEPVAVTEPADATPEDEPQPDEPAIAKTDLLATTSSTSKFKSGTITVMSGEETLIDVPDGMNNPAIFFGAVSETGKNAAGQQNPGVTVRSKLITTESGAKQFSVTAVTPHCDAMLNNETVEFFMVNYINRRKAASSKWYSITKHTVPLGSEFSLGKLVSVGDLGTSYLRCLASIQTRNNEGYLVAQTESEGLSKSNRDDKAWVRIRGTYYGIHERNGGKLLEATEDKSEDVAMFCFQYTTTAIRDTANGFDVKVKTIKSVEGPGIFALETDSNYPGTAVTGRMVGKHPYHIRSLGSANGLSVFRVTEDHCLNPDTFHMSEEIVVVNFQRS